MVEDIRLLHVDDEPGFGELCADVLERYSDEFAVRTVTEPHEALEILETTEVDCIVSDYDMPEMDGLAFLERVRERYPNLPFILFTGKGDEAVASEAISAGVTDYLQKDVGTGQFELLANRVRNAVERYDATRRAANLDRIRTLAGDITEALVRADSREEIEQRICAIVSDSEPYRFAWVGEIDAETNRIRPRAAAGDGVDYLDEIEVTVDNSPTGRGPGGRAVREGRIAVSQNVATDPEFEPWRAAALQRDFRSIAAVPIEYGGTVYGIFVVYAARPDAFDETERDLLEELGTDIAYAIDAVETRAALRAERDRRAALFTNAPGPAIHGEIRADGTDHIITEVNRAFESVFGLSGDEVIGEDAADVVVPKAGQERHQEFRERTLRGETTIARVERDTPGGLQPFLLHLIPYGGENGAPSGWYALYTDIAEREAKAAAIGGLLENARSFMRAESHEEIAEITVEAARTILKLPANAVHLHDPETDALDPRAWTEALTKLVDEIPDFRSGDSLAWEVYATGEAQVHDDVSTVPGRYRQETSIRSEIILPLGEHGVLLIGSGESAAFDDTDVSLAKTLAAHATTALDRVEREQELDRHRSLLEAQQEAVIDGVLVTSPGGEIVSYNDRFVELWGIPREILEQGDDDAALEWATDVVADPELFRDRVAALRNHPNETARDEIELADGRVFDRYSTPLVGADDTHYGRLWTFRDITERRRRERELTRNEWIIQEMKDGVVVVEEGRIAFVNPRIAELTGYDQAELQGQSMTEFIAPEDRDNVAERFRQRVSGENPPKTYEISILTKDGKTVPVEITAGRLTAADVPATVSIVRDIRERKQQERRLRRQNDLFRKAQDIADVGSWEYDIRSEETSWTEQLYEIFELPTSEEPPANIIEYVHPDDRDRLRDHFWAAEHDGEAYDLEIRIRTGAGRTKWVRTRGDPQSEHGEIARIRGTYQDITERKERERELRRQNERLEEFASVVSHDLRNPLNVAAGRVEMVRRELDHDALDEAARAHDRMAELIEDLLTLAREGQPVEAPEVVDLAEITEACWANVETDEATLLIDTDGRIRADESRFRQLLENLIRNAVEHGGESVTVTIGELTDDAGLYVADDGPGIPRDRRDRIFESGYSTAETGTGFGLQIVQQIADAHGWDLGLADSTDGGARFEISGVQFVRD